MEYSIQELSRLSGVTTRTLRWYDQIGLLKPSRVAESGYRYYGGAEVDRLQDILYYRALGVELARIKECLDDPSFDRLAALRNHLAALEAERERLERFLSGISLDRNRILLIAPPPMALGEWVPSPQLIEDSLAFARLCQPLAERVGIRFADAGKWDIPLAYDGVHFTEQGHRAFAAGLLEELR